MIVTIRNFPDFSTKDEAHMAIANMHYSFIVGHADKLSQAIHCQCQVFSKGAKQVLVK